MADTLLSESLQNPLTQQRDPFAQAQEKFKSKQSVLSSSPAVQADPLIQQQDSQPDLNSILSQIGIDFNNLAPNDMGRVQLFGRLEQKFGPNYMDNPQAASAVKAFDESLKSSNGSIKSMNASLSNANRTLGALMGGQP